MKRKDIGQEFRAEFDDLIKQLQSSLEEVIRGTDDRPALPRGAGRALESMQEPLPETGCGANQTINQLMEYNARAAANTGGPKCFHFILGGSTPASLAADLLATAFETITYTWVVSPVGVQMEVQSLSWLKELFRLPEHMSGVMVTGATMANFVGLAAARQWWGEQHGVDVSETGLSGLPKIPVFTSGFVHASSLKVLALLGVGRGNIQRFSRDDFGRVDLDTIAGSMSMALLVCSPVYHRVLNILQKALNRLTPLPSMVTNG
jgi:glutamate/tyrosine decarboxylase-like PLP-dependent enzyme